MRFLLHPKVKRKTTSVTVGIKNFSLPLPFVISKGKASIEITPFLKRLSSYHILLQIVCQEGVFSNLAVFQELRKRMIDGKVVDGNYNR
jgi:hypothetical protein